jgi:RTX calcium-binding nonapeptide repeat (4 copies)
MLSTVVSHVRRKAGRDCVFSLALAAVVFLGAAPAHAGPTKVSWPVFISVKAAPHTKNVIRPHYGQVDPKDSGAWAHIIFDSAGITTRVTEPPSCYPIERLGPAPLGWGGKAVFCPDGSVVDFGPGQGEDFRVSLGDRADWFDAREDDDPDDISGITNIHGAGSWEVHGGSGNDRLYGSNYATPVFDFDTGSVYYYFTEDELDGDRGNDRLYGDLGPDHLEGGPGNDRLNGGAKGEGDAHDTGRDDSLRGGSGNDVLWAADKDRDLLIDCGPGRHDKAFIDRQDPKPKRCETVVKRH